MKNTKNVLVLDCGGTNVRAIIVNENGTLIASHSISNNTRNDPKYDGYKIWDIDEIWNKFKICISKVVSEVVSEVESGSIVAATVTTFGVDGAPIKKDGTMLYPVISWQCPRTEQVSVNKYIDSGILYEKSGVQPLAINTINKLIWLKENEPKIYEEMDYFLFISSIFTYKLCGELTTDITMLGTSGFSSVSKRGLSKYILKRIGLDESKFPRLVEPGDIIGLVNDKAANELGIPKNIKVISTGHDTQFAIFGASSNINEPVLSSGTWEIFMLRSDKNITREDTLKLGLTTEYDAIPNIYDSGMMWIASGGIEWVKRTFYTKEMSRKDIYKIMDKEAEVEPVGSNGVFIHPSFFPKSGPYGYLNLLGSILGLTINTKRASIYRAILEALSYQTKVVLDIFEKNMGIKAKNIICVGGGSKNNIWNQIRADVLGIPIKLISQKEITVLGAAMFAFSGALVYKTPKEMRDSIPLEGKIFYPSCEQNNYKPLIKKFKSFSNKLSKIYSVK